MAVKLDSTHADAFANRGMALMRQGKRTEAQRDLSRAVKLQTRTSGLLSRNKSLEFSCYSFKPALTESDSTRCSLWRSQASTLRRSFENHPGDEPPGGFHGSVLLPNLLKLGLLYKTSYSSTLAAWFSSPIPVALFSAVMKGSTTLFTSTSENLRISSPWMCRL